MDPDDPLLSVEEADWRINEVYPYEASCTALAEPPEDDIDIDED